MDAVLRLAGAAIGGAIGGPFGAQVGYTIGAMLAGGPNKNITQGDQPLSDLKVLGAEYGQPIPYVIGRARLTGQMWWNSDRREIRTTTVESSGGKRGGRSTVTTTTITYKIDALFGLTNNVIVGVRKAWKNGELRYNVSVDAASGTLSASTNSEDWDSFTVYTGASDQMPDPTYEAAVGTANAIAYRGRGIAVMAGMNLGRSGVVPNWTFEVIVDGGSAATYSEWGGRSPSLALGNATAVDYDDSRGELWIDDVSYSPNSHGQTGRVAVYNLTNETWEFIEPPSPYTILRNGQEACHSNVVLSDWGVFYCEVRIPASHYTSAAISLADKTVVDTIDGVLGTTGTYLVCPDVTHDVMLVGNDAFADLHVYSVDTSSGLPSFDGQLATGTGLANVLGFVVVDNDGNFWASITTVGSIRKMYVDGVVILTADYSLGGAEIPFTHQNGSMAYDSTRNCIYFFDDADWLNLKKFDCDTHAVSTVNDIPFVAGPSSDPRMLVNANLAYDADSDRICAIRGGSTGGYRAHLINPTTGESEQIVEITDTGGAHFGGGKIAFRTNVAWAVSNDATNSSPPEGGAGEVRFSGLSAQCVSVQTAVERVCALSGLEASDIDASGLSSLPREVCSMALSQIAPARQALELLASAHFFEMYSSGTTIKFAPRGGAIVDTIPYEDIGASTGETPDNPLPLKFKNDIELNAVVAITHINIDNDYQDGTEMSDRLVSAVPGTISDVRMALGLTPTDTKKIADAMVKDQVASNISASFSLLGDYSHLEPTDRVTVTGKDGSTYDMRIVKVRNAYPIISCDAVLDDATVIDSRGVTFTAYAPTETVTAPSDTQMELMDIPILLDANNNAGFYVATKNGGDGAAVLSSNDDVDYTQETVIEEDAVFGTTTTALNDWGGPPIVDHRSSVTVNVGAGTLSSSTRTAVLDDLLINLMLIGDEIVQFITATLISTGVYKLTGLLRGLRGTEWAMTGHTVGERCVLLRYAGVDRVLLQNNQLGLSRYYKGVTLGRDEETATAESFTCNGIGLKPFAPVDFRIARDASNNATITFQRRPRFTVRMIGALGVSVPMDELVEAWDVEIYSSASYATLLRTITSFTSSSDYSNTLIAVEYTAAQQTADGLTPGNTIYARAHMRSQVVGQGYALEAAA